MKCQDWRDNSYVLFLLIAQQNVVCDPVSWKGRRSNTLDTELCAVDLAFSWNFHYWYSLCSRMEVWSSLRDAGFILISILLTSLPQGNAIR